MKVAKELDLYENSVEVNDIKCGSVNVTLMIYNVTDSNLERKLMKVTFKDLILDLLILRAGFLT